MDKKTRFISINEEFTCGHCGNLVKKAEKTCRNHCTECLYSLHVDGDLPGDRKSECKAEMKPTKLIIHPKKGYMITHTCTKCGQDKINKAAPDDNFEKLTELLKATNEKNASC